MDSRRKTILVLSQVYVPDPASVGQHMADAAAAMAGRGYRVVVLTSSRGYDNPSVRYPLHEVIDGVDVRRVPLTSFGKRFLALRLLAGLLFVLQCTLRGLFTPRLGAILVSTAPPICSLAALFISWLRGVPICYWIMDLNPDELIALGRIKETSLAARVLDFFNRLILRRARAVIVLDRFMAERVNRKLDVRAKMYITPPWPHEDHLEALPHEQNPFRQQHGLTDKFVVMYSGNLSIASPVDTILEAALKLADEEKLVFLFIGGGHGKKMVEAVIERHRPKNIISLPYQPLSQIRYSLSAADVHLVSLGENMAGIIHPCKVYGAMAVARPVLLLGPASCHIADILRDNAIGWHIAHGDVAGAERQLRAMVAADAAQRRAMGEKAQRVINERFSKQALCTTFCDALERVANKH